MDSINVLFYALHAVFAGVWAGAVVFLALVVLPLAREGELGVKPLAVTTGKLTTISRVSAVVLFVTGSHMAALRHTADTLTGRLNGQLVIAMIVLWLVLIATVEIGAKKIRTGTDDEKIREPARESRPFFLVATLAAVLLLVTSGLITSYNMGFL